MAKNRFMAVIPCHRVIASGGKIGGFSGGIELKKKLLSPEGF
jgi:O-6-methylguanine DNA methyltransferase